MEEIFPSDWIGRPEAEKIDLLKAFAKKLISAGVSVADALPQLREKQELIQSSCRNPELTQFLRNVKSNKVSLDDLVKAGDTLSLKPQPFLLDSVFVPNGTNLVIGREKKGKTAFVVAWIAAWHFGCQQFCGFDLVGDCPPVVIIGPDMSEEQWGAMLHMYHLADEEGQLLPDGPIKLLLHMGHGLTLDQHGLDLIDQAVAAIADQFPGQTPLFIFDSYARLVDGLGLQEATSEIAGPMAATQAVLRRHKVTDVWLHHSAANRETGRATSRGSTALPALADQQIFLEYPSANEDDNRTMLRTKGRSIPARALIERTQPDGVWEVHANGDDVEAQQRIQQRIDRIRSGTGSEKCFIAMQALHSSNPLGVDLWQIAEAIGIENQETLRKPLHRLIALSLIDTVNAPGNAETGGRPREKYRILASVRKVLGLDSTVQKAPLALGNKEERQIRSESPDSNGSQNSLAHMESHKSVQKGMQGGLSYLSSLSGRAEELPALNGSTSAVHDFIRANPEPHPNALANQIKAKLNVDISGAGVKAIRDQLADNSELPLSS